MSLSQSEGAEHVPNIFNLGFEIPYFAAGTDVQTVIRPPSATRSLGASCLQWNIDHVDKVAYSSVLVPHPSGNKKIHASSSDLHKINPKSTNRWRVFCRTIFNCENDIPPFTGLLDDQFSIKNYELRLCSNVLADGTPQRLSLVYEGDYDGVMRKALLESLFVSQSDPSHTQLPRAKIADLSDRLNLERADGTTHLQSPETETGMSEVQAILNFIYQLKPDPDDPNNFTF